MYEADQSDLFLEGNDRIEQAIRDYYAEESRETFGAVLEVIRQRMHEDGHLLFPVITHGEEEMSFTLRSVQLNDGSLWNAAFTTREELEKGELSPVLSFFIDSSLKNCLESGTEGFVINPWGQKFFLTKESIRAIFDADKGVEYTVPEDPLTPELLEDGSFLKRAAGICGRNRTWMNVYKLMRILRNSDVWIPCTAVLSDADQEAVEKLVQNAEQNGENYFFPVFTSEEEMGEYGNGFSKIGQSFTEAIRLAAHNQKEIAGIVINAFSEAYVIPKEQWDMIAGMPSDGIS